jgi:hypothetical protein
MPRGRFAWKWLANCYANYIIRNEFIQSSGHIAHAWRMRCICGLAMHGSHAVRVCASVLLAALSATVIRSQTAVNIQIDVSANRHQIDSRIYGVAFADSAALADLRVPLHRWGGNPTSRHNWQVNASNRASDWFFESIADGGAVAGEASDTFISDSKTRGAEPLITIPMLPWVAKVGPSRNNLASFAVSKYGAQTATDQWFPDAGSGVSAATGQNITGNDPNDANAPSDPAFQGAWVQHIVGRWGAAGSGGVRYYALDNEPSIWHVTHRDVHPSGATMDEVFSAAVAYAWQVKSVDPAAQVMGPEEWGWSGYLYSGADLQWGAAHGWNSLPDRTAHGNWDYVPWFLDQMRQRDQAAGQRLLDIFTLHFYPQGGQYGNDTSNGMQDLRSRSTRALWDPNYVDESWIGTQVRLIPRMKQWASQYYPGTKVGITEYNWGAEGHINGATTQADILGIFGREGLDLATIWTSPAASTPTYKAIKLYRNYDGQGSAFGDTSVSAVAPSPDALSVFAAQRSSDGKLTVMAVNKSLTAAPSVNFNISNFSAVGAVQVWRLTSSNAITRMPDTTVAGATLSATLPTQSITLFVIPSGSGSAIPPGSVSAPMAPTNLRIVPNGTQSSTPSSVVATAGTLQSTTVNSAFATALRVIVRNASSTPMSGVTVTFTAPSSGASARFGGSATATAVTDTSGVATAPALTANGTAGGFTVTASVSGTSAQAFFSLTNNAVGQPPGGVGTWTNVTPAGINLAPDGTVAGPGQNYGLQGVVADPSRPGTLYASVTYQGVWKSIDYGLTWSHVNVTSGQSPADSGRANLSVAPDGSYLIANALYPINGVSNGAWKSLNGGQTWTRYNVGAPNGDDIGFFQVNRHDPNRVLAMMHSVTAHVFESRDAGQTWIDQGAPGDTWGAHVFWVDDNTLLALGEGDNGPGPGTWRGVRSGSAWPWTWTWTYVSTQQHWHGASQIFVDEASGTIFTGGAYGIQKSTNNGVTWTTVGSGYSGGVVATPTRLYSTASYANNTTGFGPGFMYADRTAGGVTWTSGTSPAAMNNGWFTAAVVFDGTRYIVISGNWNAGIWRLAE